MSVSLIQLICAIVLITLGVIVMVIGTLGVFRIHYVLNRMHAAAMGDSLGLLLVSLGVICMFGLSFASLKVLCILVLYWIASPTCSHLLAGLEVFTNDSLSDECEVPEE